MDCANKSTIELIEMLKNKQITSVELTRYYLAQIEKYKDKNAVLEVFDDCIERAQEMDKLIASSENLPKLAGIPILIKDNILYEGKISSCASKMLEKHVAQYSATAIAKLLDEGVVILGRTNMDEFAMGGSCENSAFGPCKNAHDDSKVSGGSSGGSAVAVALDMCAFALGSDTGGSVRQPSSYNGTVGIKPTYGRVSRFGLVAFASSLDQIGVISKNVADSAYVLSIIAGGDINDATSSNVSVDNYLDGKHSLKGKKIAIIKEVQQLVEKTEYTTIYQKILEYCQKMGAIVTETALPDYDIVLPVYYTIAPAEASSNLGRFDGIKYTARGSKSNQIEDIYVSTRSELFGNEVKRRIMIGNYVLSSEYYNAYYVKAKRIQQKLKKQFANVFLSHDVILMPTTFGEAFDLGAKTSDPVSMYIEDMFTVTANIVGLPCISIPCGKGKNNLPLGLQIMAKEFDEKTLYSVASCIEQHQGGYDGI